MKRILSVLLPDGENEHSLLAARSLAQTQKIKLYILSTQRWAPVRFSRHSYLYKYNQRGSDNKARLQAVIEIIKQNEIDVILPVSEEGVSFLSTMRRELTGMVAIPFVPSLPALNIAKNKWLLSQFAHEHDLPSPKSILLSLDSIFYQQISSLDYPILMKPTSLAGGKGILRFETPKDLEQFLNKPEANNLKDNYFVQSYIPGTDFGLNVLCHHGKILAYTIQQCLMTARPFGMCMAMQFCEQEEVLKTGQKLLSSLHWNGFANIDMRRDKRDGQIKILEVNPRIWGSLLGSLVAGVNFPYLACLGALNIPFQKPQYQPRKYLHSRMAINEIFHRLFRKSSLEKFSLMETGLKFVLADPFPELVKKIQARYHNVTIRRSKTRA